MSPKERLAAARAAAQARDFERAETLLREVLEVDPDSVPALDLLGFVLYFLDRPQEAEQVCRRTLELRPEHPYALKGLGLCVAKRGDVDEAIAHIEKAIELEPLWFDPYWDLLVTLLQAKRYDEVFGVIDRARGALPNRRREWDAMERRARQLSRSSGGS